MRGPVLGSALLFCATLEPEEASSPGRHHQGTAGQIVLEGVGDFKSEHWARSFVIVGDIEWNMLTCEAIRYSIRSNLLLPSAAFTSLQQRSCRSPCNQSNSTPSLRAASNSTRPMSLVVSKSVMRSVGGLATGTAGKLFGRDRGRSAGTTDRPVTLIWDIIIPSMMAVGPRP